MRRLLHIIIPLSLLAVVARPAGAATPLPETGDFDLTIMVLDTGKDTSQVAMAYAHRVSHDTLTAGLRTLARSAGATFTEVSLREEPLYTGAQERGTSVEFRAVHLLRRGAPLPVEAFSSALPDWTHLRIVFIPEPNFSFAGPTAGTVAGKEYRLIGRSGAYEYDVASAEKLPPVGGEAETPLATPSADVSQEARGLSHGIRNILLGVSALLLVVAAWIFSHSWRKSTGKSRG